MAKIAAMFIGTAHLDAAEALGYVAPVLMYSSARRDMEELHERLEER